MFLLVADRQSAPDCYERREKEKEPQSTENRLIATISNPYIEAEAQYTMTKSRGTGRGPVFKFPAIWSSVLAIEAEPTVQLCEPFFECGNILRACRLKLAKITLVNVRDTP